MNLTYRKLALLEKDFIAKEEAARIEGYCSSSVDKDLQGRVKYLLDKVRSNSVL